MCEACLKANGDDALNREINEWQSFEDDLAKIEDALKKVLQLA